MVTWKEFATDDRDLAETGRSLLIHGPGIGLALSGDRAEGRRTPLASGMPRPFQRPSLRPRYAGFTEATRFGAGWQVRSSDVPAAKAWKRRVLRRGQGSAG